MITRIHWRNFQLQEHEPGSECAGAAARAFRPGLHKEALVDAIDDIDALMGATYGVEAEGGNSVGSLIAMISSDDLEIFHLVRSDGWRDVFRLNELLVRYSARKVRLAALLRNGVTARPVESRASSSHRQMACAAPSDHPFNYFID